MRSAPPWADRTVSDTTRWSETTGGGSFCRQPTAVQNPKGVDGGKSDKRSVIGCVPTAGGVGLGATAARRREAASERCRRPDCRALSLWEGDFLDKKFFLIEEKAMGGGGRERLVLPRWLPGFNTRSGHTIGCVVQGTAPTTQIMWLYNTV